MDTIQQPELVDGNYKMNKVAKVLSGTALAAVFGVEVATLVGYVGPNVMVGVGAVTLVAVGAAAYIDERARLAITLESQQIHDIKS